MMNVNVSIVSEECVSHLSFSNKTSFSSIHCQDMYEKPMPRIFKGTEVLDNTRYPFHVQIMVRYVILNEADNQFRWVSDFCGGVLLSKKHVLTAGHCVYEQNW